MVKDYSLNMKHMAREQPKTSMYISLKKTWTINKVVNRWSHTVCHQAKVE